MALNGTASSQLRSSLVPEVTPGTTPATPGFFTLHQPILFDDVTERGAQSSLVAGGVKVGDTLLYRTAAGAMPESDMVYSVYDRFIESTLQNTFVADVITDGKSEKSFTCENSWAAGSGGTTTYKRYRGVEATGCSIKAQARGKISFAADFLGRQSLDTVQSAIAGATYSDPGNLSPFGSSIDVGTITIAGYTLDACMAMEMNLRSRREPQARLGDDVLAGIARGVFDPMLKFRFYVQENHAILYDAARLPTQSASKITVNLGSETLKKYRFEFWSCHITKAVINWSGTSGILEVEAQPKYSAANSGVLTVTRGLV